MNSNKLHICVIGCGDIVRKAHAPALQRLKEKVVFSFSSRDRAKAQQFSDEYGGIKAYQGIDEVLEDKDVDAVSICLPHDQHRDVAIAFAKAKKHILLEKPMTCTLKEADEVITAARKNKVKLAIAESRGYSRVVIKTKELIEQGEIGEFRSILATQFIVVKPNEWRRNEIQMGGGALIDGGVHTINVFHQIGGPIAEVIAMELPRIKGKMEGEETTLTTMRFQNGGIGQFNYSWTAPGAPSSPAFQVHGTDGTIYDQGGLFLVSNGQEKQSILLSEGLPDGYNWMMEDFVAAILQDKEPRMTGKMGKRDIAVALAAYQSVKTDKLIKIKF